MAATNKKATDWEIEDGKELVERKVCMKLESEARAFLTNNMLYQYGNRYENNVLFKSDCSMSINYFLATSHVV